MKMAHRQAFLIAALLIIGAPVYLRADDAEAAKARGAERQTQLAAFLAQGLLGENNQGFVDLRGRDLAAGDLMAEENKYRREAYAAIAKESGSSPERVGRARARQIAESSPAGVWLQRPDGTWYKK